MLYIMARSYSLAGYSFSHKPYLLPLDKYLSTKAYRDIAPITITHPFFFQLSLRLSTSFPFLTSSSLSLSLRNLTPRGESRHPASRQRNPVSRNIGARARL